MELDKLFEKADEEDAQIQFTVQKKRFNMQEIDAVEITDENTKARLDRINQFTNDEDNQILAQLDKQMGEKFSDKSIDDMQASQFDMRN